MLAADAQLDFGTRFAAFFNRDFHQPANAGHVDRGERILLDDLEVLIGGQERAGIVAAHAERGLGEIVRAEAEELGFLGDLVGHDAGARDFDHRARRDN